jgi:hypothetical protein
LLQRNEEKHVNSFSLRKLVNGGLGFTAKA